MIAGPVIAGSASSTVTAGQVHIVTRPEQGQAQCGHSIAYVQCSSGKVNSSPVEACLGRENMEVCFCWEKAVKWEDTRVHCGGVDRRLKGVRQEGIQ